MTENDRRGSCVDRERVSVGLLEQYLLFNLHDSQSFRLIKLCDCEYRQVGRLRFRTCEKTCSARWTTLVAVVF